MATVQSFSASGEDVINRTIDVYTSETPKPGTEDFALYYEVERTSKLIEDGDYKRIALQFPDELLHDSVPVYWALKRLVDASRELYVLADTSYGSCCVDEVAASHVDADVIVHYGHACLSQTSRLPVIYVFGRRNLDVQPCVDKITEYISSEIEELKDVDYIEIRHEVALTYLADDLVHRLREAIGEGHRLEYSALPTRTSPALPTSQSGDSPEAGPSTHPDPPRKLTLWIGEESPTLTKLIMMSGGQNMISYSPSLSTIVPKTHLTNRLLMRRYALIQQARDADVFGILVGTLGVASYLPLISHIRNRLKKAHKKSYTVSVGKINPSKLANFMEVECWVWIACSEGMVDSKEYLRPIITPYELELALQTEPTWSGKYVFDFEEILAAASSKDKGARDEDPEEDPDRPMFSLVTGKYRHAKRYGDDRGSVTETNTTPSQSLIQRSKENAVAQLSDNAAGRFLQNRTYQGLDPRVGQDEPSVLEQGRSGIARGYGETKSAGSCDLSPALSTPDKLHTDS